MRVTYITEEKEVQEFVLKAAKKFGEKSEYCSFSYEQIKPGCLLALRWGLTDTSVLVLKVDESFEPVVYQSIIKKGNKK